MWFYCTLKVRSTDLGEEALCQGLGTEELESQPGIRVPRNDLESKLFKSSDKQTLIYNS